MIIIIIRPTVGLSVSGHVPMFAGRCWRVYCQQWELSSQR